MDFWKTDKNRSDDFRASILVYGDTTGNCKAYGFKGKNVYNTLYQMRKRFRVYWEQSGKEDTVYEKA